MNGLEAVRELMERAVALHRAGRLDEAAALYRQAHALAPGDFDPMHLLGLLELQLGRNEEALRWLDAALRVDARTAAAHSNRGNALLRLQRPDEAVRSYDRALELQPDGVEVWCNRGLLLATLGRYDEALASYDRALALRPDLAQAWNSRGLVLYSLGRQREALADYDRAVACMPGYADALVNRGVVLAELKRPEDALASYDRALAAQPDHVVALNNRGNVLKDLQRLDEALASYDRALACKPDHVAALNNRGLVLQFLRRPAEALASYDRALNMRPDYAEAWNNRGTALKELRRLDDALASYDRALALKPEYAEAYSNRGNALRERKRYEQALADYDRALALKPEYVDGWCNRANALRDLQRHAEALASSERALALDPRHAESHNARGAALYELDRPQEALACFRRVHALKEGFAEAYSNEGAILSDLLRPEEALACYERAVALKPDYADAHWNAALCRLLLGDYRRGWEQYEWRWKKADAEQRPDFSRPLWLGQGDIAGKTLLLYAEQGLGDTLQFCRYAAGLARRGARVVLEVQPLLKGLLSRLEGVSATVVWDEGLPDFDLQCPLMSLPLALGTTLETIPAQVPYLRAEAGYARAWGERLGGGSGLRVGLVWSGNPKFKNDRRRSLPLERLLPLRETGVRLISLQKEVRAADQATLAAHPEIERPGESLADFEDTAGLIENLDVVISVDTAVAHLAGALGKPVWVLLPYAPDWRWLLDRTDSPWYPTARLFRQPAAGDWAGVVRAVATALQEWKQ